MISYEGFYIIFRKQHNFIFNQQQQNIFIFNTKDIIFLFIIQNKSVFMF